MKNIKINKPTKYHKNPLKANDLQQFNTLKGLSAIYL